MMATVPPNHASKDRDIKVWDAYSVNAGNKRAGKARRWKSSREVYLCVLLISLLGLEQNYWPHDKEIPPKKDF